MLKTIKAASHEMESHTCLWDALSEAKRRFYSYKQADHESNTMHVKNLKNLLSVVEYYDGEIFEDEVLMKEVKEESTKAGESITDEQCKLRTKNKCLALELAKSSKWGSVMQDIRTQYLYKNDIYPKDLTEAFELLEHHSKRFGKRQNRRNKPTNNPPANEDVIQGAQYATEKAKANVETAKDASRKVVTCYYCKAQ